MTKYWHLFYTYKLVCVFIDSLATIETSQKFVLQSHLYSQTETQKKHDKIIEIYMDQCEVTLDLLSFAFELAFSWFAAPIQQYRPIHSHISLSMDGSEARK